jgi:hypothetical protein
MENLKVDICKNANRIVLILTILLLLFGKNIFAQKGLFAGTMQSQIGKKYALDNMDKALPNWKNIGGYFLTFNDGAGFDIAIDFYKKGSTQLIILSKKIDTQNAGTIEDIIELKNITRNQFIQSATCAIGKNDPDIEIVALEQSLGKTGKILKAWRANRDKLHFQSIATKGISCIIEGAD